MLSHRLVNGLGFLSFFSSVNDYHMDLHAAHIAIEDVGTAPGSGLPDVQSVPQRRTRNVTVPTL